MNFKFVSNNSLHLTLQELVARERSISLKILHTLAEAESRRLDAVLGFSSLHEYCVKGLQYSEGAAYRRISAMRLLKTLSPEVKSRTQQGLESGRLTLSSVSAIQSFFQEEKREGNPVAMHDKEALLVKIEGKSKRETEAVIAQIKPERARRDQERILNEMETEVRFTADRALMEKLKRIRALLSHKHPYASYGDLLTEMADFMLKRLDPMEVVEKAESAASEPVSISHSFSTSAVPKRNAAQGKRRASAPTSATSPARLKRFGQINTPYSRTKKNSPLPARKVNSTQRYIAPKVRREILKKSNYQCTYQDPQTKRRCSSRHFLEIDHIHPVAKGGGSEVSNLRLLCRSHNQWAAKKEGLEFKKSPA